jgi:non-specific serine/threonine protein kinase
MLPLAPLATPADEGASEAVDLFVARARARDPGFELTPDAAAAVAEICRRLDGLPLAIELAAARVAVLSPAAMLARWDTAVGLDTEGARDLPSRQRTLRSAFDWSYDLLEPGERALLRRLAAFPDGFELASVEAAQRGDGDVLAPLDLDPIATLGVLVDRSLLVRATGTAAEPRFAMLVTVRQYLRERLAQHGEEAAADLWMARTLADSVQDRGAVFPAKAVGGELDRFDRELNTIRVALDVLLARDPSRALELTADLFRLWQARHVREGRDRVERALAVAGPGAPPVIRAKALFCAMWLAHFQGDYPTRTRWAEECLSAAREGDDPLMLARGLYIRGTSLLDVDPAAGAAYHREALALSERIGDRYGVATASNDLGEHARSAGNLEEAEALYSRALEVSRALDDSTGIARGAHNLAHVACAKGDLDRAAGLFRESLAAAATIGDRHSRSGALAGLVIVAARRRPTVAAATLRGVAEAELAEAGVVLDPIDDEPFERAGEALTAALGEQRALEARARGRRLGPEEIDRLVARVLAGDEPTAPADDVLSPREREVVRYLAAGMTNAEIAGRLVLSEHTIHRHVANILVKLGARSRAAAAVTAAERGLL